MVLLGAGRVGKSAIMRRFLSSTFSEQYRETVEDLFYKEYDIEGTHLKVDFLDTAGNIQFPAMRRLSISSAHAFILVYSITNEGTYNEVKSLWEQIKEERSNYQDLPCVVVGNKLDMENDRQVEKFDTLNWAYNEGLGSAFVEVSAKEGDFIIDIFKILFAQTKNPRARTTEPFMVRRLSAHSLEQSTDNNEELEPDNKKFSRSRSLIRRGSKPKIRRSSRAHNNRNDCCLS